MTKTQWLGLYEVATADPDASVAWKEQAAAAMRRLAMGFGSYDDAMRYEDETLRPLFRRVGWKT
ncbi:MAG: hypothetical protein A2064_09090 [Spirochaetes bacterium GWB1_66_5]|nr:MAG: hypothetical protein A2064_09090 [Spirochaetes bacterium GWB1_66_5]